MLRTALRTTRPQIISFSRSYAVIDPYNKQKPTSQGHATAKEDKEKNIQSEAVAKARKEHKEAGPPTGEKKEHTSKAPGPVIGMQDERGGKNE